MKLTLLGVCLLFGASLAQARPVKNIVLMIGDGMGAPQVTFGIVYARQSPDSPYKESGLQMERLMRTGQAGFMLTYPQGNLVVDSAASATQLATGYFAGAEMIGLDAAGNRRPTILENAKKSGRATGVVSTARLTHATPAAFIAHVPHRSMETLIAEQVLVSAPDVLLSAGYDYFLPKSVEDEKSPAATAWRRRIPASMTLKSSRGDERDLLSEAEKSGYQLAFDFQSMQTLTKGKLLGLFGASGMPTGIAEAGYENDPKRRYPTLKDMTEKALEVLAQDPEGFFLMVEGGQIDWAGHANDAGWLLNEILQFDKAVGAVLAFAQKNPDTLVIVTADHETGSFGFSYSKNDVPAPRKLSGDAFRDALFAPKYNFGDPDVLRRLRQQKRPIEAIQEDFQALKPDDRKPEALSGLVKDTTGFELTTAEAAEILAAANAKGKPTTNSVIMEEFKLTFASNVPGNLIGHALAKEQQVVWGTGTHTMSMVPIMVLGPEAQMKHFRGLMHSTDVNHAMQTAMGLDFKKP